LLGAAAVLLLAACIAYDIYVVWAEPNPGLTFNARWEITNVDPCDAGSQTCPDTAELRPHDRLASVGGIRFEDYVDNPSLVPFGGFSPGESVPLVVERDGQSINVEWRMQPVPPELIVRFTVVSLLVYGTFWLAGTYVLRYMRPADQTWSLLVVLFYLTTIWLATGLVTLSNVAYAAQVLRIVGWLIAPVMVHLHLVAPNSRLSPRLRPGVIAMYGVAVLFIVLQLTGIVPWLSYLGAILLAAVVSIGLLIYKLRTPRAPSEKMIAQLMLAGIVIGLVPGLILSAIPLILNIGGSGAVTVAFSILALPMLPLFYIYAIYKYRLGERERRVNRFLVQYALFLLYFMMLALVFVIMSNWTWTANALLSIGALIILAAVVALLPIRGPVQTVFDSLTYGTRYSHREILADFTIRIPATVDRQELVELLKYELAPRMELRQSALYVGNHEKVEPFYTQSVGHGDGLKTWDEALALINHPQSNLATVDSEDSQPGENLAWVHLAIPLRVKGQLIGVWLFGRRQSDHMYSQADVDLLNGLSGLVAVTLQSSRLFDELTKELAIRERTELRLAEQSERLRLLHAIDLAVLEASTPADVARAAFAGIGQLVPCTRTSVFLFDQERQSMVILAAQGRGDDIVTDSNSFPVNALAAIPQLLDGQMYVVDDILQIEPGSQLAQTLSSVGIRAVISAPLMAAGTAFGALSVGNDVPGCYDDTHAGIVEEVASSVALAIHSALLREELDNNSRELQLLSARLISAQEIERKRMSHELHDEMGQLLTAISLNLAAVERNLPEEGSESLRERLADANEFVFDLTNRIRSLSIELRPSMLHDLGLLATLRWYVSNYARRNDTEIDFEPDDLPERLPEDVEITTYRVIQEALTNVSRHSHATEIGLKAHYINGQLKIVVEDNGCGFDVRSGSNGRLDDSGIGLVMMRERVGAVGGQLNVYSAPGSGTRISAVIPVKEFE